LIPCVLLLAAACATHPGPSRRHSAAPPASPSSASSASATAVTPSGQEVLDRAEGAFRSAGSVTVTVDSTSAGDAAPPFDHWTETITPSGKTTSPRFSGEARDPVRCASLDACASYFLTPPPGYPLTVVGRTALYVSAQGSNDGLDFPGWNATVDAATYAPVTVVDGVACTHCFYLTYHFHLATRG
jgi:hypothetical protein